MCQSFLHCSKTSSDEANLDPIPIRGKDGCSKGRVAPPNAAVFQAVAVLNSVLGTEIKLLLLNSLNTKGLAHQQRCKRASSVLFCPSELCLWFESLVLILGG